jgi:branched-chain amino acid transport system substrate-binding protein
MSRTLIRPMNRRQALVQLGAVGAAATTLLLPIPARAAGRPIRLGFVSPKSGPLAPFGEADDFVLAGVRAALAGGIVVNGANHPVEIIAKDSQSNPNRAAEVASALIKSNKIDLMLAGSTADTVNPVADQCEINRVPCITNDAPWQPYFFGRGGKPDHGFDWTYHFFWGLEDLSAVFTALWSTIPTNKVVGALWPNDAEGNAFSHAANGFPPLLAARGFKLIDSGRFQPSINDFAAQISAFKAANVEIVTGVLPPPAFATFWNQAAQQGFKPKIATIAKALLFPAAVATLGERAIGLTTEVWWSPTHPYKSLLTGQSAADMCAAYEMSTKKQWTQPLGFRHALFEIAVDALKRTKNIESRESIRDAIRATRYQSIVGLVAWDGKPVKNVTRTPLVGGQWVKGKKWPFELVIVNNDHDKSIPVQQNMMSL